MCYSPVLGPWPPTCPPGAVADAAAAAAPACAFDTAACAAFAAAAFAAAAAAAAWCCAFEESGVATADVFGYCLNRRDHHIEG